MERAQKKETGCYVYKTRQLTFSRQKHAFPRQQQTSRNAVTHKKLQRKELFLINKIDLAQFPCKFLYPIGGSVSLTF